MKLILKLHPFSLLWLLILLYAGLWFLVLFGGNTAASFLMHDNIHWGSWNYQTIFNTVPEDIALPFPKSGFYYLSVFTARLLGMSFYVLMLPNLFGLIVIILGAFFVGMELRNPTCGFTCAVVTAAMPPVIGLSQAYESTLLEMAAIMWFFYFFLRFSRSKGLYNLPLALGCGLTATLMGTIITFQALVQINLAIIMLILCVMATLKRLKEGEIGRWRLMAPWIGAFIIGVSCSLLLLDNAQWGRQFQYHFSELGQYQTEATENWLNNILYYPLHIFFRIMNMPAILILILGSIFTFNGMRKHFPLAIWALAPLFILVPIKKMDLVYILDSVPALCILAGLAAERLIIKNRILAVITIYLLFFMTFTAFTQSFTGRHRKDYPIFYTSREDLPDYAFLVKQVWSDKIDIFNKRARVIAEVSDQIVGPKKFCYPSIITIPHIPDVNNDNERFRACISMARPHTWPFFPTTSVPYTSKGEPALYEIDFFVVVLDDETAGKSGFKQMVRVWVERVKEGQEPEKEIVLNRLSMMLDNSNQYTLITRGSGMAFYRLKYSNPDMITDHGEL